MMHQLLVRRPLWTIVAIFLALVFFFTWTSNARLGSPSLARRGTDAGLDSINNATLGFEKIFVVGLPERTDRRDGFRLQADLSNLRIEFIDGVKGDQIANKAIPVDEQGIKIKPAELGCWRGHMNAIGEMIRQNLSSVLILEDDADWDVRIHQQLRDFALSTRALIQPLAGSSPSSPSYADPTFLDPTQPDPREISFDSLPNTALPHKSPYGDDWDLLWVGNCGLHFPFPKSTTIPKGRVIHRGDETVAPKKNLWSINRPFTLLEEYPAHTRAVSHAQEGVCTLGYALSHRGARRIMQEIALKPVTDAYDILLRFFCEGTRGRKKGLCLAPQPPYFHHHRPAGPMSAMSDIGDHEGDFRKDPMTDMVRWSVRLNSDRIIDGRTDFVEQYPDEL
ncbi:LPS glycosyltransferase, putative [Beauveria bassiana ARSEF 2860]|uniref:LPS glycosyltransferase, putative n=1 Tax=Beauveria bassiana (strain ARSEF 2860) TaxID=655819 RepID=J4KM05_BEAB2|nr:LPS glycosyltransferase, putative [Beauveria bassiana ARSEF 2860]EJP63114.1 LPS glycosyltransferase, putative [Beauveria bassiana ARSEF 2860]